MHLTDSLRVGVGMRGEDQRSEGFFSYLLVRLARAPYLAGAALGGKDALVAYCCGGSYWERWGKGRRSRPRWASDTNTSLRHTQGHG